MCRELDLDSDFVARGGAFCFAGGIGNTGAVCGAVAGAAMAIGLSRGKAESMEEGFRTLKMAQEFRRRFEAEMGTISCRELTGMDLSTEEGVQRFMASDKPQTACVSAVGVASTLVVNLLKEATPAKS